MGWETRARGGRYYTRSKKVGGRVVREHVGAGTLGELAEETDRALREERATRRRAVLAEKERIAELEGPVESFCQRVYSLVTTMLESGGYHRHKGEWRKRRAQQTQGQ